MTKSLTFFFLFMCFFLTRVEAQEADSLKVRDFVVSDTIVSKSDVATTDTLAWVQGESIVDKKITKIIDNKNKFTPNSTKAVLYALIPGGGQIYNRKYWKLPIVYGGFLGLTYAISWNGKYYNQYKDAYAAIMSENRFNPGFIDKWQHFLRPGVDPNSLSDSQIKTLQNSFKRGQDSYRRNRDLSIIGMVALYAITMIDAYVDAELFNFDISPDLSLRVEPANIGTASAFSDNSLGIQCSLRF